MQLLEIIDYGPNTFGTDEKSGENSENIGEIFTQNALTGSAHRPGKKGEKNTKKTSAPFFRRKNRFSEKVLCF